MVVSLHPEASLAPALSEATTAKEGEAMLEEAGRGLGVSGSLSQLYKRWRH